jgi:subtilisin family serine protease
MYYKSTINRTFSVFAFFILMQVSFAAATRAPEIELDGQGRPLWEEGIIWVKVTANVQIDRNILELRSFGVTSLDAKIEQLGIVSINRAFRPIERPNRKDLPDLTKIFTLELPPKMSAKIFIDVLSKDANVEYAERVPAVYQEAIPNDEFYAGIMYHLPQIQAEEAWDIHKGEDGVEQIVVGVCDTGIDWKHPDLANNIYNRLGEDADGDGVTMLWDGTEWVMDPDDLNGIDDDNNGYIDDLIGWNMIADASGTENNDPMDPPSRGHGSHVSGLAAGVTNNETGIASISWNVKVFATSHGYSGDNGVSVYRAYDGLVYLADNGADIINASWGGGGFSQGAEEVIRYISGVGALFVSSAGNGDDGAGGMTGFDLAYPSSYPGCISVASVDRNDFKAWYSTFGWGVDISAPGGNHQPGLISTVPYGNGYDYYSGTSMASPVAAGMFALVKSYYPDWTNEQLINQVIGTSDDIERFNTFYGPWLGAGRINAYQALIQQDVSVPNTMELALWDVSSSNPAAQDWVMEPGESTDLSFVIRSYTHVLSDSAVTFTLVSNDPDILVSNASILDTIFADDYSTVDPFTVTIAEGANTESSPLYLVIEPQSAEVLTGDSLRFDLLMNTTSVGTNFLDLNLVFGDVHTSTVTLSNSASTPVSISAGAWSTDPNSLLWHVDSYNAYEGNSWWCGNQHIGGYTNSTIQYLDLPILDLSGSSNPILTFKLDYSTEDPAGAEAPYDGWDGANVWISTDGGDSYQVIDPVAPAYNATALYAWGEYWGLGIVPGWAGESNGYTQAQFNLSAYATNEVIVRFGFASDGAVTSTGIFLDNIVVSDDASTVFENTGVFGGGIQLEGFPSYIVNTPWLEFPNASNPIPGNGTLDLEIVTNTREMDPGAYSTTAYVLYEDFILGEIDVALSLTTPTHDLTLVDYQSMGENVTILKDDSIMVYIENTGASTEYDFNVAMVLQNEAGVIFTDTISVDSLESGMSHHYRFSSFNLIRGETLALEIEILNVIDDYNDWNDRIVTELPVNNIIEDFMSGSSAWNMGGWGVTTGIVGHGDTQSAHVDAGRIPYAPNLDNAMMYSESIDLTNIDNLAIVYWTVSQTEQNVDVMTFEASTDGLNWDVLRSHSGNATNWTQHAVDVSNYITEGNDQLWFRFHFVSNESVAGMGLFVDDVAFYTDDFLSVDEELTSLPQQFDLFQNYPNPFNPSTTIRYALPQTVDVRVQIFDIRGRIVNTLFEGSQSAGFYQYEWKADDSKGNPLSTGVYLVRIEAGAFSKVIKMVYLK